MHRYVYEKKKRDVDNTIIPYIQQIVDGDMAYVYLKVMKEKRDRF
jgi:hypothetical protein